MAAGHDASVVSRTSMMTQGITLRSILLTTLLFLWPLLTACRAETFEDFIYSTNGASATIVRYTGTNQSVTIPDYIAEVPVETIADSAFAGYTNLFSVIVPYTVTNLGSAVFEGCYTLGSAYFQGNAPTVPASEDVFNGATNVTVYHWSGAEGWGSTFCGQPARIGTDTMSALFLFQQHGPTLTVTGYVGPGGDIIVPLFCGDTFVTIIGDAAFSGCTNLTYVGLRQGTTIIGNRAFEGCINLAIVDMWEGINMIGDQAFAGCINLRNMVMRQGLNMIGDRAFEGCINLTNVLIVQGLDRIGDLAFQGCSNLAGVYFEGDAPTISDTGNLSEGAGQVTVFYRPGTKGWGTTFGGRPTAVWVDPSAPDFQYEQTSHTMSIAGYTGADSSITIPGQILRCNVVSIGDSAFEGYSNLTSVVVPQGVTTIGNAAFSECTKLANIVLPSSMVSMGNEAFQGCSSLAYIAIPGGVTHFGQEVFLGCQSLTNVMIGNGAVSIWSSAFAGCSNLARISIPPSVTNIEESAFAYCPKLASVTIPEGVSNLASRAFAECTGLTEVYFQGDAPTLSEPGDAFEGVTNLTVYYRAGTAGWGPTFAGHPTVMLTDPAVKDLSYVQNGSTITITGYTGSNDTVVIPNNVYGKPVVAIGDSAFEGFSSLTNITIPSSIYSIGDFAFSGCTNLVEIFLPDSITNIGNSAFAYCVSLTNVTIPVGVSCIGSQAFHGCSNLTNVYVLMSMYAKICIGDHAFEECANLMTVHFNCRFPVFSEGADIFAGSTNATVYYRTSIAEWTNGLCGRPTALWIDTNASMFKYDERGSTVSLTRYISSQTNVMIPRTIFGKRVNSISDLAFGESWKIVSVTIPDCVTNLGFGVFAGCVNLQHVDMPINMTMLPDGILHGCLALERVAIPLSVTNIDKDAFAECARLKDVSIPDGVVTIGEMAFSSCSNLTSFHIPGGVRSIGNSAFQQCSKLTNVVIANGLTNLGYKAFYLCTNLVSITLPDTLTTIGGSTFSYCRKLVSVAIPRGITDIQSRTFYECRSLPEATIPVGVTNVGDRAFFNCTNLTRLTIPDKVTRIGPSAFEGCKYLDALLFEGDVPKVYDNTVFAGCVKMTVYYHPETTGWGLTMAGYPTAIWDRLVPYEQWAEGYGLPTQYPDACGGMDDPDLDGVTNIQELRTGTDPTNPNSLFAFEKSPRPDDLIPADKTAIRSWQYPFYFGTVLRKRYVVQYAESLAGPWYTVTNFIATTTQKRVVTDKWLRKGFYRAYQLP